MSKCVIIEVFDAFQLCSVIIIGAVKPAGKRQYNSMFYWLKSVSIVTGVAFLLAIRFYCVVNNSTLLLL